MVQRIHFAGGMWLLSRLLIVAAMLLLVPLLPAPPGGIKPTVSWEVFSWWDSLLYKQIAISGYEYANDGKGHNVAFFPVFPLVIRGVMTLGLPFEVAGILVNNLAFLGALIVLYYWVEERHTRSTARWATAVLAWCPLSLFGTVIYQRGCICYSVQLQCRLLINRNMPGLRFGAL
jgi:Gpi18-like mannosyltransferase